MWRIMCLASVAHHRLKQGECNLPRVRLTGPVFLEISEVLRRIFPTKMTAFSFKSVGEETIASLQPTGMALAEGVSPMNHMFSRTVWPPLGSGRNCPVPVLSRQCTCHWCTHLARWGSGTVQSRDCAKGEAVGAYAVSSHGNFGIKIW